jgi:methionyl aminopeptidase
MTTLETIIDSLAKSIYEGRTGNDLERCAELLMDLHEVEPAFKGYQPKGFPGPYPAILCVSINGEVIHGIPDDRKFEDGDVVKIDCGIKEGDQFDDGATTVIVGRGSAAARRLVKAAQEALEAGVAAAKPGATTNDIAAAVEAVAKQYEVAVIHGYGGHGIGAELHMEPFIPNEVTHHLENKTQVPDVPPVELTKGMRIAIEPMFSSNRGETVIDKNGWTVKIKGGGIAAHFERTVTV